MLVILSKLKSVQMESEVFLNALWFYELLATQKKCRGHTELDQIVRSILRHVLQQGIQRECRCYRSDKTVDLMNEFIFSLLLYLKTKKKRSNHRLHTSIIKKKLFSCTPVENTKCMYYSPCIRSFCSHNCSLLTDFIAQAIR